jgi:hypothetical protein
MAATSFARSTLNRAVHLRITPRPSNIGESREILRLISQFGHVEHFRNLKYDALSAPNAALVIFKEADAAEACLKRSPIRFRLGPAEAEVEDRPVESRATGRDVRSVNVPAAPAPVQQQPRGPTGLPFGMGASQTRSFTTGLPSPPRNEPPMPFIGSQTPSLQPVSRIFQIQTNPARKNFRDNIDTAAYHGNFLIDGKSVIQEDLVKRVPIAGLSCWNWRKGEKLWRVVDAEKKADREGTGRRKSLGELYEEGNAGEVKGG